MIIHVNSIDMNNGVADGNGALWYVETMQGWDSPEVRSEAIPRPGQHGTVSVEGLYSERTIEINGVCKAPSEAAFYNSWYYLSNQTNYMGRNSFVFSVEEDVHRRCLVRRAGKLRMEHIGVGAFRFTVTMRADDPMKYSVTLNTLGINASTPTPVSNAGTMRTYPIITMDGTGTPTITNTTTGMSWSATASIPSGTEIDMYERTVLNGATDHFDKINLSSEWLYLESGSNTMTCNVPFTVEWRDAWL